MIEQALAAASVLLLTVGGLWAANVLFDRGGDSYLSRRVPASVGGLAYLIAVLWLDVWTATILSGALTGVVLGLRLGFLRGLRGVRGGLAAGAWAEIAYPLAGTVSLAVGWGLLGDRWLAFVPIAFMAWGDTVSAVARGALRNGRSARVWPSVAMLATCLAIAALYEPYWIGALGALLATGAERFRPTSHSVWDDNWVMVAASLSLMALLAAAFA